MNRNMKKIVGVCLAFSFNVANAADVSLPITFNEGDVLTAPQLNDNFNALKDGVNAKQDVLTADCNANEAIQNISSAGVTCTSLVDNANVYTKTEVDAVFAKKVSNFASNSNFDDGTTGWTADMENGTGPLVAVPLGTGQVIQNVAGETLWASSNDWITIDHNQTYEVKGTFQLQTNGATGGMYLAVRLKDADGVDIAGNTGSIWWFHAVDNHAPPFQKWIEYKAQFGPGTSQSFPAEAVTATVGFILNFNDPDPGDRIYQVRSLNLQTSTPNSTWTDLILESSFTNAGGVFQTAQYRKTGDNVCLRGQLTSTTDTDVILAYLPPTFRPPANLRYLNAHVSWIDIKSTGEVFLRSAQSGTDITLSFDGICFSTSP